MTPPPHRFFRLRVDMFWWRPYDAALRADGTLVYSNYSVPWATRRVFRGSDGTRLIYTFIDEADRATDIETITRQVRAALPPLVLHERTAEEVAFLERSLRDLDEEQVRATARVNADIAARTCGASSAVRPRVRILVANPEGLHEEGRRMLDSIDAIVKREPVSLPIHRSPVWGSAP